MDSSLWWDTYRQLASAFGKKPDQEQAEAYLDALKSVPTPTVRLAIQQAIRECKHFPRVSELRAFCSVASRETMATAPQFQCATCGGNTWVDTDPIESHGLIYRNVVKRCVCTPKVKAS